MMMNFKKNQNNAVCSMDCKNCPNGASVSYTHLQTAQSGQNTLLQGTQKQVQKAKQ